MLTPDEMARLKDAPISPTGHAIREAAKEIIKERKGGRKRNKPIRSLWMYGDYTGKPDT